MPKLTGVFADFKDIDKIPIPDINRWLSHKVSEHLLLNFIGNRIIYPQAVPASNIDLEIDFAILREVLKRQSELVYNPSAQKIVIPDEFTLRFPPLPRLVLVIVEALNPKGLTSVLVRKNKLLNIVGSVIAPHPPLKEDPLVSVNGQSNRLKLDTITILTAQTRHIRLKIDDLEEILVNGGQLGLVIDLRTNI